MKKFFALFLSIASVVACDTIDEPLKNPGSTNGPDTTVDEALTLKKVLIEEFTGVTCNNCPNAAKVVKQLIEAYPGRVVAMGIHAGGFANPNPADGYPDDLRTEEGTAIFNFANPAGVPSALIDRTDYGRSSFVKFSSGWASSVAEIVENQEKTDLIIDSEVFFNTSTRELDIETNFTAVNDLAGADLYYAVMLTENDVITAQKLPDNSRDPAYAQQHVLRASINSAFGLPLQLPANTAGSSISHSNDLILDSEWVAENCHVVIYVYDDASKRILQAEEIAL